MAPHIHREDVEDVTVKVGQSLRLIIHIDGEPPPEVTWSHNGRLVDSNVVIQNEDYITKFTLTKATR